MQNGVAGTHQCLSLAMSNWQQACSEWTEDRENLPKLSEFQTETPGSLKTENEN